MDLNCAMLRLFCYHTIPVNIVVYIAESRTSYFVGSAKEKDSPKLVLLARLD